MSAFTRRSALGLLFAAAPFAAFAAHRGVAVDVSPLRRSGDTVDADFLAEVLPGYLAAAVGPGHSVRVRIDDVTYGSPGSNGAGQNGAVDSIEGVGWIDGREIPVFSTVQVTNVHLPDIGGYEARERQDQLARSFAVWLPRQAGI